MLSEAEMLDALAQRFPIRGARHTVELVPEEPARWTKDGLYATVRLIIREPGRDRQAQVQTLHVLPHRHCDTRGLAYLEASVERARELPAELVPAQLPTELFLPELLDAPIEATAFARVLADPRACAILARRATDRALLTTLDPAARGAVPALRDPALDASVLERLDDVERFAVYGDWLTQHGDPRGELVAIQLALAKQDPGPYDPALCDRERLLLATYAWEWLGTLAWAEPNEVTVAWRHGFVAELRLGDREHPSTRSTILELAAIAKLPSMTFLEQLAIAPKDAWTGEELAALGRIGLPPATRSLDVETAPAAHLGSLEPAYPALARIEQLVLTSRSMDLGTIDLPAVRDLELVTRGLTRANVVSLFRASPWRNLERLVLWIGNAGVDGCDVELDHLAWLFADTGARLPALRHLGICGRRATRTVLDRLGTAPVVRRLEVLEVADGDLSPADLDAVRAYHGAFLHLRELRLPHRRQGARMTEIGPNVIGESRHLPAFE